MSGNKIFKRKFKWFLNSFCLLVMFILCTLFTNAQTIKTETITINPYLEFQNYEHFKRLTLSSPDSEAEFIKGFEFQWGFNYKLKVKVTDLKQTLSDGTRKKYELISIISKTKVLNSTQFQLLLDAKRYYQEVDSSELEMNNTFRKINESTYLYFDTVEIEVPAIFKKEFESILVEKRSTLGTFIFVDDRRIRIVKL